MDPLNRRNIVRINTSDGLRDEDSAQTSTASTGRGADCMDAQDAVDSNTNNKVRLGTREVRTDAQVAEGEIVSSDDIRRKHEEIAVERPTTEEGWKELAHMRWPGIGARLDRDPIGLRDTTMHQARMRKWSGIFEWLDSVERKWVKGKFKSVVVMGESFDHKDGYDAALQDRVVRPVGINANFAVNLVSYANRSALKKHGENYHFSWHIQVLPVCGISIITKQNTTDEKAWKPKWRKDRRTRIKDVQIATLGHDDSMAAVVLEHKNGTASHVVKLFKLYIGKPTEEITTVCLLKPEETPSALACTKEFVLLGYESGGLCVVRRNPSIHHEWQVDVLSEAPGIRSISLKLDPSDNLVAMCGVEDERGSVIAMNFGIADEHGQIAQGRFEDIFETLRGSEQHAALGYAWKNSFWPKDEDVRENKHQRKFYEEDEDFSISEPPTVVRYESDPVTQDQVFLVCSTRNCRLLRMSQNKELARAYLLPNIGTFVDAAMYGDVLCGHTAKNGVLVGSLNQGAFMHEHQTFEIGADKYQMNYHYKSIQMFAERIAVLLSTGDVMFLILK